MICTNDAASALEKEAPNMVRVEFERSIYIVHRVGPVPWVQLEEDWLRIGPDSRPVAHYRNGVWTIDGDDHITKFGIGGPCCTIRCANKSERSAPHGPYARVEVVDGAVYTQPHHRVLARLDEGNHLWFTYADGRCWPVLVIEDVEERVTSPGWEWENAHSNCRTVRDGPADRSAGHDRQPSPRTSHPIPVPPAVPGLP
jgi:hypothetical protein